MVRSRLVAIIGALILLSGANSATAQEAIQLRGRVVDSITGAPVAQAIVRVPAMRKYTLTDTAGLFALEAVPRGGQTVVIVQLGYAYKSVNLDVQPGRVHVVSITPQPIQLAPIVVENEFMNRIAQRRATDMGRIGTREPVFWRTWDRDQISESGADDPLQFLQQTARIVIRRCVGLGMPADRLCVAVPFDGALHPAFGGVFSWRPRAIGETRGWRVRRPSTVYASIYFDDRRVPRVEDLPRYSMSDIARVETYGYRGERMIRLYTIGYMRLVAAGLVQPDMSIPPDVFEFFPGAWRRD